MATALDRILMPNNHWEKTVNNFMIGCLAPKQMSTQNLFRKSYKIQALLSLAEKHTTMPLISPGAEFLLLKCRHSLLQRVYPKKESRASVLYRMELSARSYKPGRSQATK